MRNDDVTLTNRHPLIMVTGNDYKKLFRILELNLEDYLSWEFRFEMTRPAASSLGKRRVRVHDLMRIAQIRFAVSSPVP
jgi:hypothetical protein